MLAVTNGIGVDYSLNVLVIATHPDDETLGSGGTLLRYARSGDVLHWLLVTAAHEPEFSSAAVIRQKQQVAAVARAYPFETLNWLKLKSTMLETVPLRELVESIRDVVIKVKPQVVFGPHCSDVHSDHRIVFQAYQSVFKSFYMGDLGVDRVLASEVPSETDAGFPVTESPFVPNVFVDVSDTFERKLQIMKLYETEIHQDPLPRGLSALKALARYRGGTVGVEFVEAFMLMREFM